MQLILLIALLLASGKGGDEFYKEVKPLIESVGGEDIKQAFKSAEEFKGVLAALGSMGFGSQNGAPQNDMCDTPPNRQAEKNNTYTSTRQPPDENTRKYASFNRPADTYDKNTCPTADVEYSEEECKAAPPFAMAPVARIADREIIYRLVQYFSEGASNV